MSRGNSFHMILERTVFILGAGASAPYGFPQGTKLAEQVLEHLQAGDASAVAIMCQAGSVLPKTIDDFRTRFLGSSSWSLDQFAASDPAFVPFAKIAMTCMLGPLERPERVSPPFGGHKIPDWYGYLFRHMLPPTGAKDFSKNNLRVLTFNFDRSFEYRLWLTLKANYGESAASDLAQLVPVLHAHGDLGPPDWLHPEALLARPYAPLSLMAETVVPISDRLRLVQDEIDAEIGDHISDLLDWAEQICFIGLAYHSLNLNRLRLSRPGEKHIWGSRLNLEDGEVRHVESRFAGIRLTPKEADALQFLRLTGVANEWR